MGCLRLLVTVGFIFFVTPIIAQVDYFTASMGVSLPTSGRVLYTQSVAIYGNGLPPSNEVIASSYGKGATFDVAFLRETKKNFSWGIEVRYLSGFNTVAKDELSISNGANAQATWKTRGTGFFLTPFIQKSLDLKHEKFKPYASVGLVIGKPHIITNFSGMINNVFDPGRPIELAEKLKTKLAVGMRPSLGILFDQKNNKQLFLELSLIVFNPWQKEGELLEYSDRGIDQLPGMTDDQKTITFKREVDSNSSDYLAQKVPFGAINFKIGFRFMVRSKNGL